MGSYLGVRVYTAWVHGPLGYRNNGTNKRFWERPRGENMKLLHYLKDEMSLKSRGPIPLYYKLQYGM